MCVAYLLVSFWSLIMLSIFKYVNWILWYSILLSALSNFDFQQKQDLRWDQTVYLESDPRKASKSRHTSPNNHRTCCILVTSHSINLEYSASFFHVSLSSLYQRQFQTSSRKLQPTDIRENTVCDVLSIRHSSENGRLDICCFHQLGSEAICHESNT